MERIKLKPVFVQTKNVRNFDVMMDALAMNEGEGCFGMVFSRAGRGKTRTSQWYSAHNDCVYLRVLSIWRSGELDFLKSFCRALDIFTPPKKKGPGFDAVVDNLLANQRPVLLDEAEKMPPTFLDVVRDIADCARVPVVLIGEEELVSYMERNRRVWSRTFRKLEFQPIEAADIIMYATEAANLKLTPQVAAILHKASDGDFRLVKRDLLGIAQAAQASGSADVTETMAKTVIKAGLTGR